MAKNVKCPRCYNELQEINSLKTIYFREYEPKTGFRNLPRSPVIVKLVTMSSDKKSIEEKELVDLLYCPIGNVVFQKSELDDLEKLYFDQ